MTYSINTSKYTAKKVVEINGKIFKVRRFTTDEQFRLTDLQAESKKLAEDEDTKATRELYNKALDLFFALFDDEKGAREILAGLDMVQMASVYKDIMENAPDDVED